MSGGLIAVFFGAVVDSEVGSGLIWGHPINHSTMVYMLMLFAVSNMILGAGIREVLRDKTNNHT